MDGQTEVKLEGILDKFTIMMEETAWMQDVIPLKRGWWGGSLMGGGNKSCAASIQVMNPLMNAQQRQKVEDESDEGRGGGEVSVP